MFRACSLLAAVALIALILGLSPVVAAPPKATTPTETKSDGTGTGGMADEAGPSAPKPEPKPKSKPKPDPPRESPRPELDVVPDRPGAEGPIEPPPVEPEDPLRVRALQIEALIAGTLDLEVDPASLFEVDLADPALVGAKGERLQQLLQDLESVRRPPRRRPKPRREAETPPDPATELTDALLAYLRLTAEQRQTVLALHAQRQAEAMEEREASSRRRARLAEVSLRADRLAAFLAGTLDVEVDPRPLLVVDLASAHETALAPERRRTWMPAASEHASPPRAPPGPEPTPTAEGPPSDPDPLAVAEARLDELRRRFLALPAIEQAGLFERHAQRQEVAKAEDEARLVAEAEAKTKAEDEARRAEEAEQVKLDADAAADIASAEAEAEEAAAERAAAEEQVRQAHTEAERILGNERIRLLQIKEDQAGYEAELLGRKAERIDNHERALEWSDRVSEVVELFGSEQEDAADEMYQDIRAELSRTRTRLAAELRRIREPGAGLPTVGEGLDRELADDIDRGEIGSLRAELLANEAELQKLEQEVAWELAQGLRDDVVRLNRTRLRLLDMASPELYDDVTGFGDNGVDQVQRELDQISVELGFQVLKLPRYKDILLELLRGSPLTVASGVVQLLLVMLGVWWWRRRWPGILRRLRQLLTRRHPISRSATLVLIWLWYLERIRRPLELLLALWIVLGLAGDIDDLPELVLPWIIVRWILIGMAVILLLDAIAARDTMARHAERADSSRLRIHSLRVVGISVIAVGLILSLTSAIVGRGAIYSWVISTCWLLSVPVALYLVHRWRPIIVERLAHHSKQGAFVTWARAQQTGWIRFVAATAAAGYLFAYGLGRWFMRHLGGLEATRRVLAYLFRREVAKQAAATAAAEQMLTRVDPACYSTFDPEHYERHPIEAIGQAEQDAVVALIEAPRSTLTAVIGERGKGKTTFLRRLEQRLGSDTIKVVSCPEIGLEGLMLRIAALTGDRDDRGPALAEALHKLGPMTIAIDDAQRLIQPAIGGLRDLDRLTAFAREVGGDVSWVIAMGSSAWHYLKRARGNRVFFEQEVELPRWTEEQLGMLIRARCSEAKIDPSFEGLVVPRPIDALANPDDQRTEAGYHRLLWDFSRGNPAVTLHAFRESLFVDPDGQIVVRLFKEPPAKEIEGLSLPLLFVLRAVVQLDVAQEHELRAATQLPAPDVSDALRFCLTREYVERYDAGVRLTWHWYRTITTVLHRQHLLSPP